MKSYINYCGEQYSGKTTTLCLVIDLFKSRANTTVTDLNPRLKKEKEVLIQTTNNRGRKLTIVICTRGDKLEWLLRNHELFDKGQTDYQHDDFIMVTASHNCVSHFLFIQNYVSNEIDAHNQIKKKRGEFNYSKIASIKDSKNMNTINTQMANALYTTLTL